MQLYEVRKTAQKGHVQRDLGHSVLWLMWECGSSNPRELPAALSFHIHSLLFVPSDDALLQAFCTLTDGCFLAFISSWSFFNVQLLCFLSYLFLYINILQTHNMLVLCSSVLGFILLCLVSRCPQALNAWEHILLFWAPSCKPNKWNASISFCSVAFKVQSN